MSNGSRFLCMSSQQYMYTGVIWWFDEQIDDVTIILKALSKRMRISRHIRCGTSCSNNFAQLTRSIHQPATSQREEHFGTLAS